jgi:uncharacterized protein YbjT (DUF2867 family)
MKLLTATVLGATGLIGEQLVEKLLSDDAFNKVRILVRRPVEFSHKKLEVHIANFDDLVDFRAKLGSGDYIFCCIGTTQKQVKGDKAAYKRIDFDIAVNAAKMARDAGYKKYLLVSSVGADAQSSNFYLRLKGQVEKAVAEQRFETFHVFRPSMLVGKRKEFRFGELIGKGVMSTFPFLFIGRAKKYKPIKVAQVAQAMIEVSKSSVKGMVVHHYEDMKSVHNS